MDLKAILGDSYREDMTLEEVESALKEYALPEDKSEEIAKLKKATDAATKDASEWKKKYRDTLSETEKAQAEEAEKRKALEENYNALLKKSQIADYTAQYLALGFNQEKAEKAAIALSDGKVEDMFKLYGEHLAEVEQSTKTKLLDGAPKPKGTEGGNSGMTKEKFYKLSPSERYEFYQKNPEEYKSINGG